MSKHTPGPWHWQGSALRAGPDEVLWGDNIIGEGATFAERIGACGPSTEPAAEANARLIAAAPDLLQTLKHVEGALLDIKCERESILKGVRAAIAKATGGAA